MVAAHEFRGVVSIVFAVGTSHDDFVCVDVFYDAVVFGDDKHAAVVCDLMFDAGCDHRRFGTKQRHCLTLHVRSHQRTVRIVVFKERNKSGCNGYQLFGRYVHIVDAAYVNLADIFADTARNALVNEFSVFVKRFAGLRDDVLIFLVRRHISDVVGNDAFGFFDLSVRRFDKSVFVDACVRSKRSDKTDVLSFGRFYRAHTTVVSVVNVTDFEAGSFP